MLIIYLAALVESIHPSIYFQVVHLDFYYHELLVKKGWETDHGEFFLSPDYSSFKDKQLNQKNRSTLSTLEINFITKLNLHNTEERTLKSGP